MIIPERPSLERRVLTVLEGSAGIPARIPVVLGGCGAGRTSLLLRLRDLIGRTSCQYIDVERVATTPERFFSAIREYAVLPSPHAAAQPADAGARQAFDATLAFLDTARASGGGPATFLLDEFLELRTFESFPGLRTVLRDFIGALATSGNRFVLASRYPARALRLLREAPSTFEIIHVTPLAVSDSSLCTSGAAIATIVWSMNVMATANIIAVRASHLDLAMVPGVPDADVVIGCSCLPRPAVARRPCRSGLLEGTIMTGAPAAGDPSRACAAVPAEHGGDGAVHRGYSRSRDARGVPNNRA